VCTALELIHEPRHSLLSPSLSKNSAAQVVAAGFFQLFALMPWKGCWSSAKLTEMPHTKVTTIESKKMIKK
jgi:hypothetical protein